MANPYLKHKMEGSEKDATMKCRNCGEKFSAKWNLMNHRKRMHSSTVAVCRNYTEGQCNYSDEMCWWNHSEKIIDCDEHLKCFICNKIFAFKALMMKHRKDDHPELINPCNKFKLGNCWYREETCWFKHKVEHENPANPTTKKGNDKEDEESESVFQGASEILEPPLSNPQKTKKRKEEN